MDDSPIRNVSIFTWVLMEGQVIIIKIFPDTFPFVLFAQRTLKHVIHRWALRPSSWAHCSECEAILSYACLG
jgi:hypothetical protein